MPHTIKLAVGSGNPVKINAAQSALTLCFPEHTIDTHSVQAPSSVPEQPMTAEQTLLGAKNRLLYCVEKHEADFYIAIEGGVDRFDFGPATFAYIAITHRQKMSIGRSALLPLPDSIYNQLTETNELGTVMDNTFNTRNIKQQGGAIGLLTNGLASRRSIYQQAIILAMAPFLRPEAFE